ncbi:Fur family transcriptional regulator [Bacteroides sp. 224]|uniref:Fur family transcriptional regulator n=1 Tax=Bacteroides sp. 224 TaxID=2302936 RepID=UPI0013D1C8FF|nr:transcriptional repressor [Bacteroides sp. 224]NDV67148.1 transcriptional repressor [Bacteroides sp. 224]
MDAYELLVQYQIKPSVQRLAVMKFLIKNRNYPTAEDIYTALFPQIPTLSKTTVYNTLKLFVDHGAVRMITIDERSTRFDLSTHQCGYFLCKQCGAIFDFQNEAASQDLAFLVGKGHQIAETHYYYKGLCEKCAQA